MLLHALHKAFVKQPVAVAVIAVLYGIHGRIRIADKHIGIFGIPREYGYPYAARQMENIGLYLHGSVKELLYPPGSIFYIIVILGILFYYYEFIATGPERDIIRRQSQHPVAEFLKYLIPHIMPVGIVYGLKAV